MKENPQQQGHVELTADSLRQAVPLFKGIDYQIWQSVLAWFDLAEDALLVIEGAEDFDVLSGSSATTNQIKSLAAPISLRSPCVCDAIRNFWITRNKNLDRAIKYRFITTATLSVEAGTPFGSSKSGLELWNEEAARTSPQHSQLLRDFIITDPAISKRLAESFGDNIPSLIDYIGSLTLHSFHEFIQEIQWLPSQPDIDVVRETVRIKLHAYGEQKHLSIHDSERALPRLFEHVAHVAIRQQRTLTREDFRVLFDDSTRVSVPFSQYGKMQAAYAALQTTSFASSEVNYALSEKTSIPEIPSPCAERTAFIEILSKEIAEHGFVSIQGSTGKGKSTVAKLLVHKIGGNWVWSSFSGLRRERGLEELYRLSRQVVVATSTPLLLLDDFNPSGADLSFLIQKLAVLCRLTLMRGGRVIVTTQRLLNDAFLRQINLPPTVLRQIVAFEEEEIRELCLQADCPQDKRLAMWVNIISSQTARHPQLVHARVKVAKRRGWPLPDVKEVIETPKEITDERLLARHLLQELEEGEIELLYRLSLASECFRKDQVVSAAEISPPISRAGDKFDSLLGPWIEPAGGKYYRLSPLLAGAAADNWTTERFNNFRVEYAKAIRSAGNLTIREASEILFQAVMAKNAELGGWVLASLMLAPFHVRKNFSGWLDWVLLLLEPSCIFPENQFVVYCLSTIQFRIAVASESALAPKFGEQLYRESKKPISPSVDAHVRAGATFEIILAFQITVSPSILLHCWLDLVLNVARNKKLKKIAYLIERGPKKPKHVVPRQPFDTNIFSFILCRSGDVEYLRQFLSAVDALSKRDREKVIAAIKANSFRVYRLVDNVWTNEETKEKPDWDNTISAFRETFEAGNQWGIADFCSIAARAIAIIQDEYLGQSNDALKTLSDATVKVGDSIMLRYQRGMVHDNAKEYDKAYEAWNSTLDQWPNNDEEAALYALNAFSHCGAAAGFLNRWANAATAFNKGANLACKVCLTLDVLKFKIDEAYAQWRAGARKEAVENLLLRLGEMEILAETQKSEDFHTLWKVMEHIIVWVKCDSGAPHGLEMIEPRPGICSEVKSKERHALVKDAPRAPALLSLYCLAEAELYAGLEKKAFSKLIRRKDLEGHPNLLFMIKFLQARRAIVDGNFGQIPILIELSLLAKDQSAESDSTPSWNSVASTKKDLIEEYILCALLEMSANMVSWESVLMQWIKASDKMKEPEILMEAIETIRCICGTKPLELYKQYSQTRRFSQVVASLQMTIHPETTPSLCYVGLWALIIDAGFALNLMLSHQALGKLTRDIWLARISAPFELRSPKLTIPLIKAACESGKKGRVLAASILLAATEAVNVGQKGEIKAALEKLAAGMS